MPITVTAGPVAVVPARAHPASVAAASSTAESSTPDRFPMSARQVTLVYNDKVVRQFMFASIIWGAVGPAVAGLMNPLFAAVLMPLSSLATLAIVGLGLRRAWG